MMTMAVGMGEMVKRRMMMMMMILMTVAYIIES